MCLSELETYPLRRALAGISSMLEGILEGTPDHGWPQFSGIQFLAATHAEKNRFIQNLST